jgi:2-polyprenyl-6-methoxyphenol hydroxylase-like FAD-dependent oxidoreductase
MRAVIVGAGTGGLAAAVALRRVGLETLTLERAVNIREAGAGLAIWSNAVNALRELGVEAKAMSQASVIERSLSQDLAGRPIAVNDFSEISRTAGAVCICVHRAVLQRILLEQLPPEAVRTGARCVGFEDSTAMLEDGERIEGDILVGADGIHSAIRERLHGTAPPRYAGYTCWRGLWRGEGVLPEGTALLAIGAGTQIGLWPCGVGHFYWFVSKNAPVGTAQTRPDAAALCGQGGTPIREIVDSTPEDAIVQNDVFDRPPLAWWGRGRVTLLGDAAHATTPNLGQGACQALEDAVVLADCIRHIRPVEAALREYERRRIRRTAAVVRDSRQSGRMLQLNQPAMEAVRNWFMGTAAGRHRARRMFRRLLTYRVPRL